MSLRWPIPLAILVSLFVSLAAWAAPSSVFVRPTSGQTMPAEDRAAVEELIRIAVNENPGFVSVATEAQADIILAPKLIRLGSAYVLTLQKTDKTGKTLFSEKMKVASMNDMDTSASRLTTAVLKGTRIASTADVTNITEQEEMQGSRRYHATRQWVIGLGPGWSSNLSSGGGGFTFLLGYLWGLDPDFAINLSWTSNSGGSGDNSSFSDFSIGGEYYFSRSKYSPFVGSRFGYTSAKANDDGCWILGASDCDTARGWGLNGTIGYKLFRTSTVNAALFMTYFTLFDKTDRGQPGLTTVQFAVYY